MPFTGRRSFKKTKFRSRSYRRKAYKKKGTFARKKKVLKSRGSKLATAIQMAQLLPDQVYLDNYADLVSVVGNAGTKAVQTIWGTQQSSLGTTNSVQVPPVNLMPHDLGILQQIMAQQLDGAGQLGSGAESITAQLLIKSWTSEATIKNVETGDIELTHYRCRARRDLAGGAGDSASLPQIINNGFTDTADPGVPPTGVTSQVLYTTYGATPFMNPRFVSSVHVLHSKTYRMAPGKSIKLRYTNRKPRLWKNEDFNFGQVSDGDGSNAVKRGILKGQTFSVFVLRGTYASNLTNAAQYRIGAGNASVGIIYQHKVHYACIAPQIMQTSAMNALAGFDSCHYPLPIVANQPYSVITPSAGPAGTRQLALTDVFTIPNGAQTG